MLTILLDEPGLFVFDSPADAVNGIEPIDAESEIRAAFDETAIPYKVEWITRNRTSKFAFGLFTSVDQGEYRLVPAGPANPAALIDLLDAHSEYTSPPNALAGLRILLARLRSG